MILIHSDIGIVWEFAMRLEVFMKLSCNSTIETALHFPVLIRIFILSHVMR